MVSTQIEDRYSGETTHASRKEESKKRRRENQEINGEDVMWKSGRAPTFNV